MALAASAAASGEILPVLFMPSVSRMTTLDFAVRDAQAVDAGGDGRADGGAVFVADSRADALEILLQPVMVERERADQIGGAGKGDEADAVVGPFLDEFRDHRFDHLDAVDALVVDQEVERLHRAGDIEPEHDVDAVGGDFGAAVARAAAGRARRS